MKTTNMKSLKYSAIACPARVLLAACQTPEEKAISQMERQMKEQMRLMERMQKDIEAMQKKMDAMDK
jgi:hypothetical protein